MHCQCILVITVADVLAIVLGVRSAIYKTLCIVDVSIARGTAKGVRLGYVREIYEDETGLASICARLCAYSNRILLLLVDDDIV